MPALNYSDPFGMAQNIADAGRVQDDQFLNALQRPYDRHVGTGNDLGWDAFFGAMQRQGQDAADQGMKFKVGLGDFGNLRPSLLALTKAQGMKDAAQGYDVSGNDKTGYSRQFGPRLLGY